MSMINYIVTWRGSYGACAGRVETYRHWINYTTFSDKKVLRINVLQVSETQRIATLCGHDLVLLLIKTVEKARGRRVATDIAL